MNKKTKIWLMIATSLVLIGCIIFGGTMTMFGWNFKKLTTTEYETNTYELENEYQEISIVTKTADIFVAPSQNEKTSVVCYEPIHAKHQATVENGILTIRVIDERKWYDHVGVNFETPKLSVFLPLNEYGKISVNGNTGNVDIAKEFSFETVDVIQSTGNVTSYASVSNTMNVKTTTGSINVKNASANTVHLSVTTGKITASSFKGNSDIAINATTGKVDLQDIACKNITSKGTTGSLNLTNVVASQGMNLQRSTGGIVFDHCDAGELNIKTTTGSVRGSLLTSKVFLVDVNTGSVDVPKSITGGKCEIVSSTGSVKIAIAE